MRVRLAALAVAVVVTGCITQTEPDQDRDPLAEADARPAAAEPGSVAGTAEPADLAAAQFAVHSIDLLEMADSPSLVATGTRLLLTGSGCLGGGSCNRNDTYIMESQDGVTWAPRNDAAGNLAPRPGDAYSLTASLAGGPDERHYVIDLVHEIAVFPPGPAGLVESEGPRYGRIFRSDGSNQSWRYISDVRPPEAMWRHAWVATGPAERLAVVWHAATPAVSISQDAGAAWTTAAPVPDAAGAGPPFWSGDTLVVPAFIAGQADAGPGYAARRPALAVSRDGGASWSSSGPEHEVRFATAEEELGQSTGGEFPVAALTGDGHIVLAWSQLDEDPEGIVTGSSIWSSSTSDLGATWSAARRLTERPNALRPWLVPGAGDRLALAYYSSSEAGAPERLYGAPWDVVVTVVDGAGSPQPRAVHSVVEAGVHVGTICSARHCLGSNPAVPGDYLSAAVRASGDLVVVYQVDPAGLPAMLGDVASSRGPFHAATQTAGSPLFVAAGFAPI